MTVRYGFQPSSEPERLGVLDLDARQVTAPALVRRDAQQLGLDRDAVHDEAATPAERRHRLFEHRHGSAAADEHRVGGGKPREHLGGRPLDQAEGSLGREPLGVGEGPRRAVGPALDADGARAVGRPAPFDGDRTGARAHIPQQLPGQRPQVRQRARAHHALGEEAVAQISLVGQPGRAPEQRPVAVDDHDRIVLEEP